MLGFRSMPSDILLLCLDRGCLVLRGEGHLRLCGELQVVIFSLGFCLFGFLDRAYKVGLDDLESPRSIKHLYGLVLIYMDLYGFISIWVEFGLNV